MAQCITAGEENDPHRRNKMILSQENTPSALKMLLWLQWRGPPLTLPLGFGYKSNEILQFC